MMERLPTRKRIRLAPEVYQGPGTFSVTISTATRSPLLKQPDTVDMCTAALAEIASQHGMDVLAYCFMPDHLHLLIEAASGNLIQFMKAFKQMSGYHHRRALGQRLWQKGYYDHVLRRGEDVNSVAEYIYHNPVRAGLVESAAQHPFSGGRLLAPLRAT
jgi:putative transposase